MATNVFDQFDQQAANPFDQFDVRAAPKPSKERTFGEAAKDIAAGVVSGAGSLVQLPGQLYGLATGDFAETGALGLGKDIEKYGEEMKSPGLKAREAERAEKIKTAEKTGQWEAFKTAFGETIKDPALLTSFLAEQAPQLLVPFGAAKVAQIGTAAKAAAAAEGLVGEAATKAVGEITKAAAERGTRAAIGAGAVQQGADVGAQAYEDIYKELKRKGASDPDAAQGAINLARAAGASGALISLLAQRLPGARTLEESFAGVPGTGGRLLGAAKGALGEGLSEVVEETGGKFGANLAMREVKPEQSLLEGLGQTAGMAAVGGVGMGGVTGLARRHGAEEAKPEAEAPKPAAPTEPEAAEAEAPKPVTGEAGIVRPEEEVKPLTMEEQREFELQQRLYRSQEPTVEEMLGEVRGKIQTAPPTTPADIARIRDEHETAVINSLLEQDKKMQGVADMARANMERMSQLESMEAATADADRRVREGRLMARVQSLIDENTPFASTAIADINRKFEMIGEAPLDDTERARVQNIMTMAQGFTDFVKLPSLPVREQDRFAENQAMEALIKERKPRGEVPSQPVRAEVAPPSEVVRQAPVPAGVEEGRAVRPEAGVEPSIAEDRERAEPEVEAAPEPVVAEEVTPTAEAVPQAESAKGEEATLWRYNEVTGMWKPQRKVTQETQNQWLNVFQSDDPTASFVVSKKQPTKKPQKPTAPKAEAPAVEAPVAPQIAPLQDAYNKAKAALDAIGTEPAKPSPEARYFGIKGRESAAPELVRAYDDKVKAYNSWRRKYNKLKKEEVEASNALFRAKQAQEKKSLRATPAQQVSDFEQTLRTALNKFGLKDVGVKLIDGMREEGSYAQQLIRIAADAANPIRTLRHEAIHALRELGFFTPQQWQSLSKMAKDKWIDQYLKQRNVDGKPLKAGEESRYDAYMREYEGDMEKITEEAVADAFADFDATKPPAGLIASLLTRLRNLFQAIKSALTKVESPEQIFGKVERGELAAGEAKPETVERLKRETVERLSLRKEETPPTPTTAGQQALDTINQLGMGVKPPEPGLREKVKKKLERIGEAPTKESMKQWKTAISDLFAKLDGQLFSADAPFENKIRQGRREDFKGLEEFVGTMLTVSQSQAVGPDAVATQAMLIGKPEYRKDLYKWVAVKDPANEVEKAKILDGIAKKYGLTKEEAIRVAHTYLSAANYEGILKRNAENAERVKELRDEGKTDEAAALKAAEVYVTPEQAAMVEPGLAIANQIPEVKQITELWNKQRENVKNVLVETGLWTPEYADAMMDNAAYVPFYREMEDETDASPEMMMRGLQVKAKEHKLKGSASPVADVFENMAKWQQYALNRAIRNHKAVQMIKVAKEMKIGDTPMAKEVSDAKKGKNVVRVWEDGKQKFYEMADPLFMDAFKSLGAVSIPTIKYFTAIANMLRQSIVLYPMFSVGQVPQDAVAAIFASGLQPKYAFKIPFYAVKEAIQTYRGMSKIHEELRDFGAVGVRDFNSATMRQDAEITAGLKIPRGGVEKVKFFLERIAMSADNAVRQAVYQAAMEQPGVTQAEALEKAFEIINFRRRGSSKMVNLIGQTVPFFYAYLSAQRVAYKTLTGTGISPTERKAALETLAYTSAAVMALSFMYAMANGDDEDYEKVPSNVRDRSIVIPGTGGLRIPLRPDFFLFPKIIAEHTYHLMADNGFSDPAKFKKAMRDNFVNSATSPNVVPQIIKPAFEIGINYDFFQGKPIIGFFEQNKEASRQFNDSTSEFAKFMGGAGLSPQKVDHFIRGYFGTVGGLFLWTTNFMMEGEPGVPRPELSWHDVAATMPGVGAFKQKSTENALKVDFYELRDAVEKAKNTYDDIKKRSPEGLRAYVENEENYAKLALEKRVTKVADHLSKIRQTIQQVAAAPEGRYTAAEKQERIKELREIELRYLKAIDLKGMREKAMM